VDRRAFLRPLAGPASNRSHPDASAAANPSLRLAPAILRRMAAALMNVRSAFWLSHEARELVHHLKSGHRVPRLGVVIVLEVMD